MLPPDLHRSEDVSPTHQEGLGRIDLAALEETHGSGLCEDGDSSVEFRDLAVSDQIPSFEEAPIEQEGRERSIREIMGFENKGLDGPFTVIRTGPEFQMQLAPWGTSPSVSHMARKR